MKILNTKINPANYVQNLRQKNNSDKRSAQARHVDACVIWCIDPRFRKALWDFEKALKLKAVDIIKVAGGGKALAGNDEEKRICSAKFPPPFIFTNRKCSCRCSTKIAALTNRSLSNIKPRNNFADRSGKGRPVAKTIQTADSSGHRGF